MKTKHTQTLIKCLLLNAAIVFIASAMEEVIVLYALGQLQLDSSGVGWVYIVAGTIELILQNTVLVQLIERTSEADLPSLRRKAMLAYAVPFGLLPFCIVSGQTRL